MTCSTERPSESTESGGSSTETRVSGAGFSFGTAIRISPRTFTKSTPAQTKTATISQADQLAESIEIVKAFSSS